MRNVVRRAGTVAAGAAAAMAYAGPVRRWMRTWGATPEEERRPLPGDELIPDAVELSTRAIRVGAPPAQVWPHLQRIGDWQHVFTDLLARLPGARRLDRPAAAPRAPLQEGDVIPTGASEMRVVRVDPERALVLRNSGKGFDYSWSTVLEPDGEGATRVVTRVRYRGSRALFAAVEPVAFAASRRWLLSLRRRAEASAAQHRLPA